MKQVESYFKDYPGNKECFTTSDGMVFHNKYDAQMHSKSLEDKDVEEHKAVKQGKEVKEPKAAADKETKEPAKQKESAKGEDPKTGAKESPKEDSKSVKGEKANEKAK